MLNLNGQSTSIDNLKKQRQNYTNEIVKAQNLLKQKGNSRRAYLNELSLLNTKIAAQKNVISSYKSEILQIETIIASNQSLVIKLGNEISEIKKGYEKLIIEANKQLGSRYNEFMLLFSAKSFSEAYRRFNLMKQYSSYRKKQGLVLLDTKNKHDSILIVNKKILAQKIQTYNSLNEKLEEYKLSISTKQNYIIQLKKDESWLRKEIARKKKMSDELERNIEKLISESSSNNLSNSFSNFNLSKGHLNWPVKNGVVTSMFGEHNHAVLKGVKVKNNGIDIAASKENEVKCVYEGTVSRVIAIPGYNKAVIVRHGKYLTVYANLVNVYVKTGEEVKSDQGIGQIYTDKDETRGILHFEIWEENKKINPILWLRK